MPWHKCMEVARWQLWAPDQIQGRIQKIQKGVAGTLNSSILHTFYFSEIEFFKNNKKKI